jgi:hypothetical protein
MTLDENTEEAITQNDEDVSDEAASDVTGHGDEQDAAWAFITRLFLEDYVATMLLRHGRPLKSSELTATDEFHVSRVALRETLADSERVVFFERDWNLAIRVDKQFYTREERNRQPLDSLLQELLKSIGKPLPMPVITRELQLLRGDFSAELGAMARRVLASARWAIEVAPDVWLHETFTLDTFTLNGGVPDEEIIIRENHLDEDPIFAEVRELEIPAGADTLCERAQAALHEIEFPLPRKVLGFLVWKRDPAAFDAAELATALQDRKLFYPFVGGAITLQEQMPRWREAVSAWTEAFGAEADIDVATLLRERLPAEQIVAPATADLEALAKTARQSGGQPVSLGAALADELGMEPEDPRFVPALQGLNDALRRDERFLPVGIGRFLLRETVPKYVGKVPEELRPVQLAAAPASAGEPPDFELSDEGMEGNCVEFIHDPRWGDIGEEAEVKLGHHPHEENRVRYILLNHHYRAGTLKLRRSDEAFFHLEGPLARVPVRAEAQVEKEVEGEIRNETEITKTTAWLSRDSGLIYGLGDWFRPRVPPSGGVLVFTRESDNPAAPLRLTLGEPDESTLIAPARAAELAALRETSQYHPLFELLQSVMAGQDEDGAELARIWAEVNVVRRTTKRLMCSVLSGYYCFFYKQHGPHQYLWRFDADRLGQGAKRNKRKFLRR